MTRLSSHDIVVLFLAMGALLAAARALGEVARRISQPVVLGELLAGILLGPTVLGAIAPGWQRLLFPQEGPNLLAFEALTTISVVLFLLVAGMEVDLSSIWRQGRIALLVSIAGIVFPFALGFGAGWLAPAAFGQTGGTSRHIFALFLATALSISALPVIAKTLMDLNLYRSDLGMVIIAAAVFNDLAGWIIFAIILGLIGAESGHDWGINATIALTLAYAGGMLTIGRFWIHRSLPWIQAHTSWPGGVLALALSLAAFGAAFTQWIGVHAIFGAFIVGVAIGDSSHLREQTRATIGQFVSFVFAPLFFSSIGLKVNFLTSFDLRLTLLVILIACLGKILGCGLAARLGGLLRREAWAVGFGMNARGAMEIILGLLALQHGLIDDRMFVALVLMALVTSLIAGPMVCTILRLRRRHRFTEFLPVGAFVPTLRCEERETAIRELCGALCEAARLNRATVEEAVLARERLMSTGLGNGLAVPHARLENLPAPVIAVGVSPSGVDFDARDGRPAHFIFLILTPKEDDGAQVEILADIARAFENEAVRAAAAHATGYTAFLAAMNMRKD